MRRINTTLSPGSVLLVAAFLVGAGCARGLLIESPEGGAVDAGQGGGDLLRDAEGDLPVVDAAIDEPPAIGPPMECSGGCICEGHCTCAGGGGGCAQRCGAGKTCILECTAGCSLTCEAGAMCLMKCPGGPGSCSYGCPGGATVCPDETRACGMPCP